MIYKDMPSICLLYLKIIKENTKEYITVQY